jgi:hypothetical protein
MNACPDLLAALHLRMRDLEIDAVSCKARIEELRDVIDRLEHPQRKRGRPPGQRRVEVVHDATGAIPPREQELALLKMITPDTDPEDAA